MNLTEQIETLKQELREFIALSEAITPGRWSVSQDRNWETFSVEAHDTICDFYYLCEETHHRHPFQEGSEHNNATFIARSRNISPTMAKMLLAAAEGLERLYDDTECYADGAPDASGHDRLCNEVSHVAKHQLQQLLKLWEETK